MPQERKPGVWIDRRLLLRATLLLLGMVLAASGAWGVMAPQIAEISLVTAADYSQMRAFHAMMLALGGLALWSGLQRWPSRSLVVFFATVMALQSATRLASLYWDGEPGVRVLGYAVAEAVFTLILIGCLPARAH